MNTIIVFTAKSQDRILADGGTSSWVLDRNNARACEYVICARNAHADWVEGNEPHGSAFLIGKVRDVIPSPENEDRWLILFSEYAELDKPDVWQGWRNPVRYTNISDTEIVPQALSFKPMPKRDSSSAGLPGPSKLTIQEAKNGLANTFGVKPDAIEIIVRG